MSDRLNAMITAPLARVTAFLAALAYLPMLTAAPGRMPADSKLYLYFDPSGFFGDAATTFDAGQFGGWVPHQHIAYLWPSLPWFATFDAVGVPDWIAHRLWVGTIMLAAGLGVRWCARTLGLSATAALAAAVVYQLSLYVLPYVSRTSVMLLPWAGLGWIVALTVRATRRSGWRDPALIALVVFTVGAVNATALAMIVPAPVLWLVHVAWQRTVTWRSAAVVALRIGALSLLVSLWWISALMVQSRHGVDVLPYSESLADVSLTATSAETWRGLGYWLFYVRDPYAATTTESLRYLSSTPAIMISFAVPIAALAAIATTRWEHRRFAALLIVTGLVLAVGVHPIGDRSPLMRLLTGGSDEGLALALRSSTRALPVALLGLALALGMGIDACSEQRSHFGIRRRTLAGLAIGTLAVANLPALWTGAMVDPALERASDPPAPWIDAVDALAHTGTTGRILQMPGAEFGAFRWGYTVDQPLPGLTDKPLITRDLLPLGSPGAMDLLYALDDRAQDGVLEPGSIGPVAQLLGADTIWLANDIAFDRFRTARPEVVRDAVARAPGVDAPTAYGDPTLNRPDVPVTDERSLGDHRVGAPIHAVELASVDGADGVVRARDRETVLVGSGDGVVDAATVGLVDPQATVLRYAADLGASPIEPGVAVVSTDSNRDRARHWRSSQDTTGFTEDGTRSNGADRAGSARLPVFDEIDASTNTTAVQRGPVRATATSYGEPFAFLPEHRAYAALDGDPSTAWSVGEHADPLGEAITLHHTTPLSALVLHQIPDTDDRHITSVSINGTLLALDERSWSGDGQRVEFPESSGSTEISIVAVAGGTPFTGSAVAGVGFVEIEHGLGATTEVVRLPETPAIDTSNPLSFVFTRLRVDATDRWRDDPETRLVREFDTATRRSFAPAYTVRLDPRASDADLATAFDWPVTASSRLAGSPWAAGVAAFDNDPSTSWITGFGAATGAKLHIEEAPEPITEIAVQQPIAGFSRVVTLRVQAGGETRSVELEPDAGGTSRVVIDPPLPPGPLTIVIDSIDPITTIDRRFGDPVELPTAIVEITVSGYAGVDAPFERPLSTSCLALATLDGITLEGRLRVDGIERSRPTHATVEPCAATFELRPGTHLLSDAVDPSVSAVVQLDRLMLDGRDAALAAPNSAASAAVTSASRRARTVEVTDCDDGCWLVVGEGYNTAWKATIDGNSLGLPTRVDGGFNGWWLDPQPGRITVDVTWTAQRPVTLTIWLSFLAALVMAVWVLVDRLRSPDQTPEDLRPDAGGSSWSFDAVRADRQVLLAPALAWAAASGLLIGPWWALWGVLCGFVLWYTRRVDLAALTAFSCLVAVAAVVVIRERRHSPLPNGGWPSNFASLHGIGMFAVASLIAVVFIREPRT